MITKDEGMRVTKIKYLTQNDWSIIMDKIEKLFYINGYLKKGHPYGNRDQMEPYESVRYSKMKDRLLINGIGITFDYGTKESKVPLSIDIVPLGFGNESNLSEKAMSVIEQVRPIFTDSYKLVYLCLPEGKDFIQYYEKFNNF